MVVEDALELPMVGFDGGEEDGLTEADDSEDGNEPATASQEPGRAMRDGIGLLRRCTANSSLSRS